MIRPLLRILPALLLLVVGCSDSSVSPADELAGVWVLVAVNDDPLPYLDRVEQNCTHYTEGITMTLRPDGTGSFLDTNGVVCGDGVSQTYTSSEDFRWSAEETLISFQYDDGVRVSFPITLTGDRLTVVTVGETMTFERE
jgi:hypothetical protein